MRNLNHLLKALVCLPFVLTLSSCDWGRTSSKERFEKNCHIAIPANAKVVRDEYQDMTSDYAIQYQLKLNAAGMRSLVNSIRHSDYYNDAVSVKHAIDQSIFKGRPGDKGVWRHAQFGYSFYKWQHRLQVTIEVDTTANTFIGEELFGG